ncbi:MAG: ABC transporter ATP-binding protein [Acidobacteriota bacterium]
MSLLELVDVSYCFPAAPAVLEAITAKASEGQLIAVTGPNGAGKSTLLDIIAGLKEPATGECIVDGRVAHRTRRDEFCRLVAHVPQQVPAGVPYSVEEVVLTGRIPYGRGLYENDLDYEAMEQAMARMRLEPFRTRLFQSLSGGERQRVLLAAALCQQAKVLLLDEPSAHLDPENQAQLWDLLRELRDGGHLILVVTHHLALAARNTDRVWLLHRGKLVADAPPREAFHPERLEAVFNVAFHRHVNEEGRVFLTYGL